MGNSPKTSQDLNSSLSFLLTTYPSQYTISNIQQPLIAILNNLAIEGSFQKLAEGFKANHNLLKIVFHQNFDAVLKGLLKLLVGYLKFMMERSVNFLNSREEYRICLGIANFLVYFSDENLLRTLAVLPIRTDIHKETIEFFKEVPQNQRDITLRIVDELSPDEQEDYCRILRLALSSFVDLFLKIFSRSDYTLQIIQKLSNSLLILYMKLFLSSKSLAKRQKTQNFGCLLRLCSFFIGCGLQNQNSSIYEAGVVLCLLLIQNNPNLKDSKALPTHLFKHLPIINNSSMLYWISCMVIYGLKVGKTKTFISFNRIISLKLADLLVKDAKCFGGQLTFYLEELCMITQTAQIQRVYLSDIAESYVTNAETKSKELHSEVIRRYSQTKQIKYNLKLPKRSLRINPVDVMTELDDDDEKYEKQVVNISAKYVMNVIFQSNISFDYSEQSLWNQIVKGIGDEDKGYGMKDEEEEVYSEGEEYQQQLPNIEKEKHQSKEQQEEQQGKKQQQQEKKKKLQKGNEEKIEKQEEKISQQEQLEKKEQIIQMRPQQKDKAVNESNDQIKKQSVEKVDQKVNHQAQEKLIDKAESQKSQISIDEQEI